jgi:hypothetical protein
MSLLTTPDPGRRPPGADGCLAPRQPARSQRRRLCWCHLLRDACGDVGPLRPSGIRSNRSRYKSTQPSSAHRVPHLPGHEVHAAAECTGRTDVVRQSSVCPETPEEVRAQPDQGPSARTARGPAVRPPRFGVAGGSEGPRQFEPHEAGIVEGPNPARDPHRLPRERLGADGLATPTSTFGRTGSKPPRSSRRRSIPPLTDLPESLRHVARSPLPHCSPSWAAMLEGECPRPGTSSWSVRRPGQTVGEPATRPAIAPRNEHGTALTAAVGRCAHCRIRALLPAQYPRSSPQGRSSDAYH